MEKKKYFVFSDVHGEFDALMQSLQEAGYDASNPEHILVSLGDGFDRGPKSEDVYCLLARNTRNIVIKGNHDEMLEEFLLKGEDGEFTLFNILHNGLGATISSFSHHAFDEKEPFNYNRLSDMSDYIKKSHPNLLKFIQDMPLYYETKNYIFCHAGVDPRIRDWKATEKDFFLWDIEYSHKAVPNVHKIVMIGHHHAAKVRENGVLAGQQEEYLTFRCYGNEDENRPYRYKNKVAMDGLTNLTHKVNVAVIEDYPLEETNNNDNDNGSRITVNDGIFTASYGFRNSTVTINTADPYNYTYTVDPNVWNI